METPLPPNAYDYAGAPLVPSAVAMLCLSTAAVFLRFLSRRLNQVTLLWDDWLILAALPFSLILCAIDIYGIYNTHFGRHLATATPETVRSFFILTYIFQLSYGFAVTFPKFSMLALYKRVFGLDNFRWPLLLTFGVCVAYLLGIAFAATFVCYPINAFWDRTVPGQCIPLLPFYIGQASTNIILDLVLLIIPVIPIRRLNITPAQKIAVTGIFFLGIFVTVCSAVRLHALVVTTTVPSAAMDPTYNFVDAAVWSVVETNLSVVCACLPSMRPLLRAVMHGTFKTSAARSKRCSQLESGSGPNEMARGRPGRGVEQAPVPKTAHSDRTLTNDRPSLLNRSWSQRSSATERAEKWWRANNPQPTDTASSADTSEKYLMKPLPAIQRPSRRPPLTSWRPNCPHISAAIDAIAGPSSPIAELPEGDVSRSSWTHLHPKARPNSLTNGIEGGDEYLFPERRDSVRVQSSHITRGGHDIANPNGGTFGYRYEIRAGKQGLSPDMWQSNSHSTARRAERERACEREHEREREHSSDSDGSELDLKGFEVTGTSPVDPRLDGEARRPSLGAGLCEWERAKRKGRKVLDEWSRRGSRND